MQFDASNWYWLRQSDGAIFSSAANAIVQSTNTAYEAWFAAHNQPTPWPVDGSGAQTAAGLDAVLEGFGLPASGLAAASASALIASAQSKVNALLAGMRTYSVSGATLKSDALPATLVSLTALSTLGTNSANWVADDGSVNGATGTQFAALLAAVQSYLLSVYAELATVVEAINASPATITTTAQVAAAAWPT